MPPDVWELLPRAGLLTALGDCSCRAQAVLENKSLFVMSSFVDRVFQHCLGSTRGKEVHSNSEWLKSPAPYYHLFISFLPSPTANRFTGNQPLHNSPAHAQYQPSFVQPFVCLISRVITKSFRQLYVV